jgi:hypothetical protein
MHVTVVRRAGSNVSLRLDIPPEHTSIPPSRYSSSCSSSSPLLEVLKVISNRNVTITHSRVSPLFRESVHPRPAHLSHIYLPKDSEGNGSSFYCPTVGNGSLIASPPAPRLLFLHLAWPFPPASSLTAVFVILHLHASRALDYRHF